MIVAYYNEIDLYAAQWLRNLIKAGHIAPGVVDTRSIEDVRPDDLREFTQCHFFAGIGIWSYSLRRAGWSDSRPVWSGSCPCQPFSSAGQGAAFDDDRHLWPSLRHLVKERRPVCILGEQVASKDADPWIDLVQDDLEALGYAVGAVAFPSASVGAPHIRDRTYWTGILGPVGLADSNYKGLEGRRGMRERSVELPAWPSGMDGGLADSASCRRQQERKNHGRGAVRSGAQGDAAGLVRGGDAFRLGHVGVPQQDSGRPSGREQSLCDEYRTTREGDGTGPTNGFWRNADWIGCRDGLWRPVESGTFPLADGITNRMGKLRAYGNAINAEQARIFIETVMEYRP